MFSKNILSRLESKEVATQTNNKPMVFHSLNNNDVITAKVSDHHPVIKGTSLFWNVMMQGKQRGAGYNNGFAFVEDESEYLIRLVEVAKVVAETIHQNPKIEIISFCEAPVKPMHIDFFYNLLSQYKHLQKFITPKGFHQPHHQDDKRGLLMLADSQYQVTPKILPPKLLAKLGNRFKFWKLKSANQTKYVALAHLPFGRGDEYATELAQLSKDGSMYCDFMYRLMKMYNNKRLILCGDFNFNPSLIVNSSLSQTSLLGHSIPSNNSILFKSKGIIDTVTVDAILLTKPEGMDEVSQLLSWNLTEKLLREFSLFRNYIADKSREHKSSLALSF